MIARASRWFVRDALESRSFWLFAVTLLTLAHFARFYDANQALVTDTRYFTHFGIEVAGGAVPHRDFFDNKTQLASLAAAGFVRLGGVLGLDGLESIRFGYLGIVVLGGVLLFLLHRNVGAGRSIVGLLGLLPYLGFSYIGSLPATGSVPKLIMAVCATAAALAVGRGKWFAAGVIAAIAPLDWQIGLVACVGVFAAAALDERAGRALLHSALGVALVAAAFVLYFALNGALGVMLAQTVAASFVRGAEAGGPFFKFAGIGARLMMHSSGELWLVALGIIGLFVYPLWFRLERWQMARKPLLMLAVYHYGVVGFSAIDFQGSGDTMLLLHSLAFFAGVTLISLVYRVARFETLASRAPWPEVAIVVLVLISTRPVVSSYEPVSTPDSPVGVTLQDQVAFSRRLIPVLEERSLLMLGPTEMLLLGGFSHESIFVFWNDAAAFEYARTRELRSPNRLGALLAEYRPGAIVTGRYFGLPPEAPYRQVDLGQPGGYAVKVYLRSEEPGRVAGDVLGEVGEGGEPRPISRATRVVLVTLDTLRLDSFENGESSSAMPLTREWARKGLIFNRHYAASSTTQPTHASLLTGLPPWQHGVSRNGQVLAAEHTTLAERFSRDGFHTGAVVSSFPLHRSFGFEQGFERYDDSFEIQVTMEWSGTAVPRGAFYSLGDSITNKALAMIDRLEGPRQFLWFHYFDLHEPYGDAARRAEEVKLAEIYDRIERRDPGAEALVERARRRYDDDARSLDRQLDRLLRRLYDDAAEVDTHVLIVSDHGESFGELGSLGHGKRLSEELIHVPCFLLSPMVDPGAIDVAVGSIDVPITLLSLAGLSGLESSGRDLTKPLPEERSVFGMRRTFAEPFRELRLDGRKHLLEGLLFFVANSHGVTTGNARQIFSDPGSSSDASKTRGLFEVFESELSRSSTATVLDAESRAALEALGYIQ